MINNLLKMVGGGPLKAIFPDALSIKFPFFSVIFYDSIMYSLAYRDSLDRMIVGFTNTYAISA
jgi:hypothetical protein